MNKNRLEAFSDGLLAIVITIMVLELHEPDEPTWRDSAGPKLTTSSTRNRQPTAPGPNRKGIWNRALPASAENLHTF